MDVKEREIERVVCTLYGFSGDTFSGYLIFDMMLRKDLFREKERKREREIEIYI